VTVALHVLSITHGIGAGLACFLVLQLAGVSLLPRQWCSRPERRGLPAVAGAAAYVFVCWFGIQANVRLGHLAAGFVVAVVLLALLRRRDAVAQLRDWWTGPALGWLGLFAGLYVLAYLFTLPPVSAEHLPLAWLGNVDVLQYLVYSKYLMRLGTAPTPEISSHSYVYLQTPGAFHLLGGFAMMFGRDPMRAAMPAIFALMALAGVVAARLSRVVFRLSPASAAVVAGVMVSGPFLRFIAGHYYLSTLMGLPVLVHLLLIMVSHRSAPGSLAELAAAFFAHDALLLFTYPYLLAIALMFQAAAIGLMFAASWQDGSSAREAARSIAVPAAGASLAPVLLCAVVPGRIAWVSAMLRELSQTGRWGWALDVISPLALLGLPLPLNRLGVVTPSARVWLAGALWVLGASTFAFFTPWLRSRATRDERVVLGLCGVGFLAYASYFALVGPSYQQWKLASYAALPLSFAAVAAGLRFVPARSVAVSAGILLLAGNGIVHAAADPGFRRLPGGLRNLSVLNGLKSTRQLSVDVADSLSQLLVAYFVPSKRLFGWTAVPRLEESAGYERISPAQPLFVPFFSCDGVGHDGTLSIDGAGCLLYQPPSLALDTEYGFNRTFMFVEPGGLGRREDWGRWAIRKAVVLRLTADQRRLPLDQAGFLNLELQPPRAPGVSAGAEARHVRFAWGAGRRAEVLLGVREWISLPLRVDDWTGEWVSTQTLSLEFPDDVAPRRVNDRYPEPRALAVGFVALSVSARPRGRTVTPLH
jgi:hypothetical protein